MLLFQLRGHRQLSSGPIETLHGTWLWLRWTRHWQMGTSAKAGQFIPTLQFRRKLAHEVMDNTIVVDTVDYGRPRRSTCTPAIFPCTLLKVKKHEGSYDRKAKKFKKVKQEYQKQRCANFKTCNQWTISFCECTLDLFLCNECFVEHKVEAVINA